MPYDAEILVIGCGNILFKDDGFGPAVIDALNELSKEKPLPHESWRKLIVVDIVQFGAEPGTIRVFSVDELPKGAYENVHSWPVNQPLHDLSKVCEVMVVGCQPESVSAPDIELGLTKSVEDAIPEAIKIILKEIEV